MKWERVLLTDVSRPKQWKTISTSELTPSGFPVYGANGKIGFYNKYTHELPTVVITCRGATCGSIHITEPKSYINGNAMALDGLSDRLDRKYLFYYLKGYDFNSVISGTAQPQITREGLSKVKIPLPPLPIQKQIADTLDKADALRKKDQELLQKYDELAQSIFYEMFGDINYNSHGFKKCKLGELISIPNKLVDPRREPYNNFWHVGGDNIEANTGKLINLKRTSDLGLISGKFHFTENCILYNKIRPYLNKVALPDFDGLCSADMYPIYPNEGLEKLFLYFVLSSRDFLDFAASQSRRANIPKINREELFDYNCIVPPITLQIEFSLRFNNVQKLKQLTDKHIIHSTKLYKGFLETYFK